MILLSELEAQVKLLSETFILNILISLDVSGSALVPLQFPLLPPGGPASFVYVCLLCFCFYRLYVLSMPRPSLLSCVMLLQLHKCSLLAHYKQSSCPNWFDPLTALLPFGPTLSLSLCFCPFHVSVFPLGQNNKEQRHHMGVLRSNLEVKGWYKCALLDKKNPEPFKVAEF